MKKTPFIQQMEHSECGLACCAMILNFHNYEINLNELRELYPAPRGGYSLLNMFEILRDFNLDSNAFSVGIAELKEFSYPLICHWENTHFVILEKVKKNNYFIVDPAKGRARLSEKEFSDSFTGFILIATPSNKFNTRILKTESVLKKYLAKYKKSLLYLILITVIVQFLMATIPLLNKWIVDNINFNEIHILSFICLTSILFISILFFNILRQIYIAILQFKIDKSIVNDFMSHLIRLPHSFYESRTTGDLIFRANSNVHIREILTTNFVTMIMDILLIVTYSIVLLNFSIIISMYLILISLFIAFILFVNSRYIKRLVDRNIREQVKVGSITNEIIRNNLDIKVMGLEDIWTKKWTDSNVLQLKTNKQLNIRASTLNSLTTVLQIITPISVLLIGSYSVITNEMTMGELVATSTLSSAFISPIVSISNNYTQFLMLKGYFARIEDVFKTKKENNNIENDHKGIRFNEEIKLTNVYYRYSVFDDYVVKNINLSIKKGETVALVVPSGSGKSTIAKLLLGLKVIEDGSIKIDNKDIRNINISSYRKIVGAVMQDSSLFHGTIRENISIGTEVDMDRIIEVTKKTCIYPDIISSPLSFETILGEEGNNFSGGQKQRLLLSRALINNPQILILDEATSHLDNTIEREIMTHINNLEITKIIIAHRLETIVNADKICVINEGEIKEIGTHRELWNRKGIYYELYKSKGGLQ
nr:peptidase domain-containing ABC transporter [Bacillus subtilis]